VSELGDEIKRIRGERGISQRTLARKAGLSNTTLAYIEAGETNPRPDTLEKIAKALDISYEELLIKAGYLSPDSGEDKVPEVSKPPQMEFTKHPLSRLVAKFEALPPEYQKVAFALAEAQIDKLAELAGTKIEFEKDGRRKGDGCKRRRTGRSYKKKRRMEAIFRG